MPDPRNWCFNGNNMKAKGLASAIMDSGLLRIKCAEMKNGGKSPQLVVAWYKEVGMAMDELLELYEVVSNKATQIGLRGGAKTDEEKYIVEADIAVRELRMDFADKSGEDGKFFLKSYDYRWDDSFRADDEHRPTMLDEKFQEFLVRVPCHLSDYVTMTDEDIEGVVVKASEVSKLYIDLCEELRYLVEETKLPPSTETGLLIKMNEFTQEVMEQSKQYR